MVNFESEWSRRLDREIAEMERFAAPPGSQAAAKAKGHLGSSNPPCIFDPEFIESEWDHMWTAEDFMTYNGRPGVESLDNDYRCAWKQITK